MLFQIWAIANACKSSEIVRRYMYGVEKHFAMLLHNERHPIPTGPYRSPEMIEAERWRNALG